MIKLIGFATIHPNNMTLTYDEVLTVILVAPFTGLLFIGCFCFIKIAYKTVCATPEKIDVLVDDHNNRNNNVS